MTAGVLAGGEAGVWERPLGGLHAAWLVAGLIATGHALEWVTEGRGLGRVVWPASGLMLAACAAMSVAAAVAARRRAWVRWLGGIPMTLMVMAGMGILALVAGVVPGGDGALPDWARRLGWHRAVSGWPFVLMYLLLLLNLGIATVKRPVLASGWRASAAPLCHAGLWIALAAGFFGAGDLQRVRIAVRERAAAESHAWDERGARVPLPFEVALRDFRLDAYPPVLAARQRTEVERPRTLESREGAAGTLMGHRVEVLEALAHAREDGARFVSSPDPSDPPAARLRVDGGEPAWITCGAELTAVRMIPLGREAMLVMMSPRPRRFASDVTVRGADGTMREATIEVNRPLQVAGWMLYQLSYDETRGAGSEWSVLEAVRDPWFPVVRTGLFLVLAGAGVLLVSGRSHGEAAG
jgi:hypothetical protein